MTKYYLATIVTWLGIWAVCTAAGEGSPPTGYRVCIVDGKKAENGRHVDAVGVRLYACSEACLEQISEKGGHVRLIEASGREPERIPVNRSRERTEGEVLENMVFIKGGEFDRPGKFFTRVAERRSLSSMTVTKCR